MGPFEATFPDEALEHGGYLPIAFFGEKIFIGSLFYKAGPQADRYKWRDML